jgi:glutaredoxin-like protein NrdH
MALTLVPGKKTADITLYALSTCGWCRKTRELLDSLGVEYRYEYVDLLTDDERPTAVSEIARWNPSLSFPTMVIDNKRCIIGFKEMEIREATKG